MSTEGLRLPLQQPYTAPSGLPAEPGAVLEQHRAGWTVRARDQAVRLVTG
ncbi:hypothetical protein OG535_35015 [Kitasatospora sp. NBC_00085]